MKKFTHIDLFSGIGGFAYAAQQVWGEQYENLLFCDNNKFCQAVIRKNFGKDSVIYEDIREVTTDTGSTESLRLPNSAGKEISEAGYCDLLTGGFPCQPFSMAGKRKGHEDDRYLWPEMLRIIKEFKPTWIIGENVAGILSMAQYESEVRVDSETDLFGNKTDRHTQYGRGILYGIITELEQVGYAVQKAGHRVEQLKALGNAIVPQVAIEIMKAIKLTEETWQRQGHQ